MTRRRKRVNKKKHWCGCWCAYDPGADGPIRRYRGGGCRRKVAKFGQVCDECKLENAASTVPGLASAYGS